MTLQEFIREHCAGRQYDSCANSPCRYSGPGGCRHPQHPWNSSAELLSAVVATNGHALLQAWARAQLDQITNSTVADAELAF
jgi:hypothetical protein